MVKKTKPTEHTEDTVRYTVDLPRSLHIQFTMLASLQGKTKAELIRLAIERMINAGH